MKSSEHDICFLSYFLRKGPEIEVCTLDSSCMSTNRTISRFQIKDRLMCLLSQRHKATIMLQERQAEGIIASCYGTIRRLFQDILSIFLSTTITFVSSTKNSGGGFPFFASSFLASWMPIP